MCRLLSFLLVFVLTIVASLFAGPAGDAEATSASQSAADCGGQWLLQLTFEGRDVVEEAIGVLATDGTLTLHSPAVVPALPDTGDEPLFVSDTVGSWRETGKGKCAFDAVRLLAADDGVGIGAVSLRGEATVDDSGLGLEGAFSYDQSSGFGKTVASGSGTVIGTSISE